ncbi:glycosyltransferase family 2 protein [Corynebacterium caspium]|uniref:glycosyltransferase family 2 protein n=1 Tax=Corynebacterium caspium TaxID=234828 RepID=UPI00036025FC|nr:glycosyltransferase family 2 protein [Corynebacterium caspium]WKD59723.1 N-acetylglucosaminyl-diphospho-decaprenol L-rhamnosyltransferase [Corynebacterium caspium DSM 44850]
MTAQLAVITVTYSPGKHLASFLDSIAPATTNSTYVVLADNGSTDGAPEAAAVARNNVEFYPTGGNIGYGAAINAAARMLKRRKDIAPDYLLIANPDVVFHPGSIDALISCAEKYPRAGAVGPRIVEIDGSSYPSARAVPTLRNGIGHALFSHIWPSNPWTASYKAAADMSRERPAGWLSGSCLLLRWEAFEQLGGFDERYFMYMEDVDLGDRLARAGWQNIYTPQATISHDQGHVAHKYSAITLPAHHQSAYRFLADRLSAWWQAPLRWSLWLGLRLRCALLLARTKP